MYIGTLTLFGVLALLGAMALVTEFILDRLVFEPIEDDINDAWFEKE